MGGRGRERGWEGEGRRERGEINELLETVLISLVGL